MRRNAWRWTVLLAATACGSAGDDPSAGESDTGSTTMDTETDTDAVPDDRATVVHSFGVLELGPLEETQPCLQWTVGNEQAIYVQTVRLVNDGASHHSNWFVVPEDQFAGADGFFECNTRGFDELSAAVAGTVLFAQSTQSRLDEQTLPDGVVIKIPPHHKLLAGGHFLNLSDSDVVTEMRVSLDIIHPRDVSVIAAPFRLSYQDLDIPAFSEARFSGDCDLAPLYEDQAGKPLDLKLYYVTPHFHYLGNFFDLSIIGGPRDGENIFRMEGFDGGSNGQAFDPPIDLTGGNGFRFTCGYDNWRDRTIGWGVGDQEMCVMLGLADSAMLMDAGVQNGDLVGMDGEIFLNEGTCNSLGLPKNESQAMPTDDEIAAPLYVPPSSPGDTDLPPVPGCVDHDPATEALAPATLSSIRDTLFASSCTYSSCHGGPNSASGLDLRAEDLHATLLGHTPAGATSMPLVAPGDPDGSWLVHLLSFCEPTDDAGNVVAHMPRNAPTLSDPALVAKVREWIAAGALDD
jgi:hypothetical protein